MKVEKFHREALKRLKALQPPIHTDEELGAGDFAGDIGGNPSLEDAMNDVQTALSWFGNTMLESLPEGMTIEDVIDSEKWQQLLSSLKYTVEVMEGKYRE